MARSSCFFRYSLVRTSQSFQSLIRMRICLPAQNRLDGFGHDRPAVVQIGIDGLTVQQQLAQTFQRALDGNYHVPHRYTDIAQDCGVRQVAL